MLEFKNTRVSLASGRQSKPFSLVVDDGDIVCICGGHGVGKSLVLKSVLGLSPISSGFITCDGELITSGSSSYFRRMIAYIPQDFPRDKMQVSELLHTLFSLKANSQLVSDNKALLSIWEKLGIDKSMLDADISTIAAPALQLILLSFLPMLHRKIILIDNIFQYERVQVYLSQLASGGYEIIYTCNENRMKCNKIVEL